ncbi:hypothetical protein GYA25_02990 [Candidatus Woesearchaeota archaeon]|jgi:hypothetical protein|nr:hypothetical protein [Candidatus Woesearchaeota archaeon]
MADIFDNTILCKKCGTKMEKKNLVKDNFSFRALVCPKCNETIIHPLDEQEYKKYLDLKNKEFKVKMRQVGNSYTVSIPKEIVSFMSNFMNDFSEQEDDMDKMVRLCIQDLGKLSLNFEAFDNLNEKNARVVKQREYKVIKNNQPIIHIKEFSDSANPKNNKKYIFKKKLEDKNNDR